VVVLERSCRKDFEPIHPLPWVEFRTFKAKHIADPALDQSAGYPRWFFDDITRGGGRRSSLHVSPEIARGWAVLAEMSSANGGTTYLPATESESELAYICSQVALELRQQYTLAFYSKATVSEGWHKLKVRIREPQTSSHLRLSYRKGYSVVFE
jgi:hypothetical protein